MTKFHDKLARLWGVDIKLGPPLSGPLNFLGEKKK